MHTSDQDRRTKDDAHHATASSLNARGANVLGVAIESEAHRATLDELSEVFGVVPNTICMRISEGSPSRPGSTASVIVAVTASAGGEL
jgi:hypothetical protein